MGCVLSKKQENYLDQTLAISQTIITSDQNCLKIQQASYLNLQRQISELTRRIQSDENQLQQSNKLLEQQVSNLQSLTERTSLLRSTIQKNNQQISQLSLETVQLQKILTNLKSNQNNSNIQQVYFSKKLSLSSQIQQCQRQLQTLNMKCYDSHTKIEIQTSKKLKKDAQQNTIRRQQPFKQYHITLLMSERQMLASLIKQYRHNYLIVLTLDNQELKEFTVQGSTTVRQLKGIINKDHYNNLFPQLMVLLNGQRALKGDQQIMHVFKKKRVKLRIRKAELSELEGLNYDANQIDPILGERGVIIMKCGHNFSRDGMRGMIYSQIDQDKQYYFTCPYLKKPEDIICRRAMINEQCQIIAGYSTEQWNPINEKLSQNYMKASTKKCPKQGCGKYMTRQGVRTKKMICVCGTHFCMQCGEIWRWKGAECESQRCLEINRIIGNAAWDRDFSLKRNGKSQKVSVANLRACPFCKMLLMNTKYCKHTDCFCGKSFCFVCLRVPNGQSWPCGASDQHCGYIAPNQRFSSAS